jgi:hypothetical protein
MLRFIPRQIGFDPASAAALIQIAGTSPVLAKGASNLHDFPSTVLSSHFDYSTA